MKPASQEGYKNQKQLYDLIPMDSPKAALEEVRYILSLIAPDVDTYAVVSAYHSTWDLFLGKYPGYRGCNTEYHDFGHTTQVFLAMARLIHGAVVCGERFKPHHITLGLMAALFHDSGYIQEIDDTTGTGAKHTATHVERSMDLFERYGKRIGLEEVSIFGVQSIILCTNLSVDIDTIEFPSENISLLGKILGAADVLAQMADRTYLEKLLFLYHEIKESGIGGYSGEVDLLEKTIGFYDFIAMRLQSSLDGVDRFMTSHFASRWGIEKDLYGSAIEKQKRYLRKILAKTDTDPRDLLKRGGIVSKVNSKYRQEMRDKP